jgi:hypothetical protein
MIIPGQFGFNCPSGLREEERYFSETTWTVETKLPRNHHWKVLCKCYVFYANWKSKMAATAIHRLTLSCGGGHLEFSIGIKKQKLCRGASIDHSWAAWIQLSKWFQRRSVLKHFSHRVQ